MTDGAGERAHPLRRTQVFGAIICAVLVLLLAVLVYRVQRSGDQRDAALARTQHSFAVVLAASQVQASMARAEAALGRFAIDSDRRTGTIYYDEWRHAGERLEGLLDLVRDNDAQAARVRRLQALYAARGHELALVAARANYRQGWAALSLFYQATRSSVLPEIGRVLEQVTETETALLDRRALTAATRTDRSNDLTRLLSAVGVLLALSAIALAWLVFAALAQRRVATDAAEAESDRATALERAVATRTIELSTANRRLQEEAATRAEAEAKLRQMQKMEAVGQLTGGIAHDFNNMLAVVLGGLEMAKRRAQTQASEVTRHIDTALEGAERAAALTRRLLSFARAQPLLPTAVAPGALLRGMADLLDRTLGERIEVRILADTDVWPVWVDAYQLENAVLNLAVNARDAMGGIGRVTMHASNTTLGEGEVGALPPGSYVRITVSDTGAGMTPEVLDRVFEPFFTTKQHGQGTGLGLSQILGFARQSGGDVAIASRPGEGTAASILLPRHEGAGAAEAGKVAADDGAGLSPDADRQVLLVEDDPRVRDATAEALRELGHRVVPTASGAEAIAQLESGAAFDLLMTDIVMPGMTGVELAQAVHVAQPELPILFVTGFTGDETEAGRFGSAIVLRKPFTLRALGSAVGAAMAVAPEHAA